MNPQQFIDFAKNNPSSAEKKIISFISQQKTRADNREITSGTVSNSLKAVRVLLDMNDVSLNWNKIRRTLPIARRYALDRIPTVEEIREIIDSADIRGKALTILFLSSGVREGAIEHFKISDYSHRYNEEEDRERRKIIAGRLVVYNGDPERYVTFVTPEACNAIDKYLNFRREHGEKIKDSSPLFRDSFDPIKGQNGKETYKKKVSKLRRGTETEKVIPMTSPAVRQYYNRLLFSIGIRKERKRRHDFSVHGFRKFFKTKAELGGMKPINVEILMGHSTGISDSYYRPTENDLLEDYLKVVDHLTISGESKLRMELQDMKTIRENEALNSDAISSLSDQLTKVMHEIAILKKSQ